MRAWGRGLGWALTALTLLGWGWEALTRPNPPSFAAVRAAYRGSDLLVLDRNGEPLQQVRLDASGRRLGWTPLAEMSPALLEVIVAAEDHRFREHDGVDWMAMMRAGWGWMRGWGHSGASTLTMQTTALLDAAQRPRDRRRTPGQKWAQMRAAWALEGSWNKDEILETYLNRVSFRGELQGIQAASRSLFDKFPSGLNHEESLLLAALTPAPNAPAKRVAARACILAERWHAGDGICNRLRKLAERTLGNGVPPIRALAFAPHAARRVVEGLAPGPPWPERVTSSLDGELQRFAMESVSRHLAELAEHGVGDAALLAVDNASGEILAYVGNGGNNEDVRYVDGVTSLRQPGSALKPFLYELAIERRLITAASLLEDAPLELDAAGGLYTPQNYDRDFKGWVSARTALASSLNVPAVRTLGLVGPTAFLERLRRLGFGQLTENADFYGYALALGSAEVTLRQMVTAYRALANGGTFSPLTLRLGETRPEPQRIMDAGAAFVVSRMLSDPVARGMTFELDSALGTPFWSAVKTGTSKNMRDNWCVGFTSRYTVGVWVGNFDGAPMHEVSGVTGAAPIWLEVMTHLHRRGDAPPPTPPEGVTASRVAFDPPLEPAREEWFLAGTAMALVRLDQARPARILHPLDGTTLALDPDIPPDRQRVFFRMAPLDAELAWRLDGVALNAEASSGWRPTPGRHRLELARAGVEHGAVVDRAEFVVRGGPRRDVSRMGPPQSGDGAGAGTGASGP